MAVQVYELCWSEVEHGAVRVLRQHRERYQESRGYGRI